MHRRIDGGSNGSDFCMDALFYGGIASWIGGDHYLPGDENYIYHRLTYKDQALGTFCGGNKPTASFLTREDILNAFQQHGFPNFELHDEDLKHAGGPCLSISFWRQEMKSLP